jgi:putative pyruvate formate lyase activating enzyme
VRNYTQINQAAVKEMHHQVGDLQISEQGLATRGLLIRHLVLPYDLARTEEVVRFIVQEISINTYINIMGQYHPAFNAAQHPKLKRAVTHEEFQSALQLATQAGLSRFSKASL